MVWVWILGWPYDFFSLLHSLRSSTWGHCYKNLIQRRKYYHNRKLWCKNTSWTGLSIQHDERTITALAKRLWQGKEFALWAVSAGVWEVSEQYTASISQAVKSVIAFIVLAVCMFGWPKWPNVFICSQAAGAVFRHRALIITIIAWFLVWVQLTVCWLSVSYSVRECFSLASVNSTSWLSL